MTTSSISSRRILANELNNAYSSANPIPKSASKTDTIHLNYLGSESLDGVDTAFYGGKFKTNRLADVLLIGMPAKSKPNCNTVQLTDADYGALYMYRGTQVSKLQEEHPSLNFQKASNLGMLSASSNESYGMQMKLKKADAKFREYIPQNGAYMNAFNLYKKNGNFSTLVNSPSIPLSELLLSQGDSIVVLN
jgi:hypothetical protein